MVDLISRADDPRLPEVTQRHWYLFWRYLHGGGHFTAYETEYYNRIEWSMPIARWQGVHLAHILEDKVDEVITSVIERYEEIAKPWTWWVGPTCKPDNLPEYLERHGLEYGGDTPYMAVELDKLNDVDVPDGLEIRLVEDSETLRLWAKAVATGYGFPQLVDELYAVESHESLWLPHRRRYVGFHDGVPVCGSCVLDDLGVAGIYEVATVPEARRRGFGTAITLDPLKASSELGVKVGVLHSSPYGYGVYKRIGFQDIGKHSVYSLP